MAKIVLTEMLHELRFRKVIVDTNCEFTEAMYPGRTRVNTGVGGRSFVVNESIDEVYKLIVAAEAKEERKMLNNILQTQEKILEVQKNILLMVDTIFPE